MIQRNRELELLTPNYLFEEIEKRKRRFLEAHPEAKLVSLSVGNTTQPLASPIAQALSQAASALGIQEGYVGYGPEVGMYPLRKRIAEVVYKGRFSPEEIFISDGINSDIARVQTLLGPNRRVAIQDPAYPAYLDGSLIQGVSGVHFLSCDASNSFFPDLDTLPEVDLIYFCSPHNPTGVAATFEQMERLIGAAKRRRALILFDAAYAAFVRDSQCPRSIFDLPGAEQVAIEAGSFSKWAGFTGVRLGWSVVPNQLHYANGASIRNDWERVMTTLFNGASILSQKGGLAVLEPSGLAAATQQVDLYLENAAFLRRGLERLDYEVYGGVNSPYLWVHFPGFSSWEAFQTLLEKAHILTMPGSGFGKAGEGFLRLSGLARRTEIEEALRRLNGINLHNKSTGSSVNR